MAEPLKWHFNVRTDGTSASGERRGAESHVELNAPRGLVVYTDTFEVNYTGQIGSEHWCKITDYRTVNGMVKGVTITAHARSQGGMGNIGERGHVEGTATVQCGPPIVD
jgi:hypothetical protein